MQTLSDSLSPAALDGAALRGLVSDTHNLAALRQQANGTPAQQAQALKSAAQQFEAILVQQWFDAVRAGNESWSPDSPLRSKYSSFFEDMLAQQQVSSMVAGRGRLNKNSVTYLIAKQFAGSLGDAGKALLKELEQGSVGSMPSGTEVTLKGAAHRTSNPAVTLAQSNLRAAIQAFKDSYGSAAADSAPRSFASPEDFVTKLMPHALKVAQESGLNPLVFLSQAALETGWGEHVPANNNYFGIKAGGSWQGPVQHLASDEVYAGQRVSQVSAFRAYGGVEESMRDYASLITQNERYRKAAASSYDPEKYFDEIQKAGYATDPQYAAKLKQIARKIAFMAYK